MKKILLFLLIFNVSLPLLGKNTPIIFVHGMLASGDTWENPIHLFRINGYADNELHVLDWNTLDFNRENGVQALHEKVKSVLKLTGAKQVNLVGHSAGGGLCVTYLSEKKNSKKVNRYIHVASMKIEEEPLVPTLNLFSPDDKITGGSSVSFTENHPIKGLDHYEIATSDSSFVVYYNFFNQSLPTKKVSAVSQDDPITIAGKACTLGENSPEVNALIRVYPLDTETGRRIAEEPIFQTQSDKEGKWEGFVAERQTVYQFVVQPEDKNKRTIYYIYSPFKHSNHHVYLRTLPTSGFAGILLGSLPADDEQGCLAVFSAQKAVIHQRDELYIDELSLATETLAPAQKTPIAFFIYGDSSHSESSHPTFKSLPFMTGVNQQIASDGSTVSIRYNDSKINIQPVKSSEGIMVVVF